MMASIGFKQLRGCVCALLFMISLVSGNSEAKETLAKYDVASLCELVDKMKVVSLKYRYDPDTSPARELHPYAVGYTPSQNILLFGLQVSGHSRSAGSDSAKGWRKFRTDRIATLVALDSKFTPVQPEFPNQKIIAKYVCKNKLAQ